MLNFFLVKFEEKFRFLILSFCVCRLIEECWDQEAVVRPTFSEIIVRLTKIVATCSKQGWWKDTFKLPWYVSLSNYL